MNTTAAIAEDLVTSLDEQTARLLGARCRDCGVYSFPKRLGCAYCSSANLETAELSRRGTLWTWTSQSFRPPSPPYLGPECPTEDFAPIYVGYVELPNQCRVISRLLVSDPEELQIGMELELALFEFRQDAEGGSVVSYGFRPAR